MASVFHAGMLLPNSARAAGAPPTDAAQVRQLLLQARTLGLYQQLGDRASQARVRNGLGISYSSRGDFSRALALLVPALGLAQPAHNSALMANCLANLGNN